MRCRSAQIPKILASNRALALNKNLFIITPKTSRQVLVFRSYSPLSQAPETAVSLCHTTNLD